MSDTIRVELHCQSSTSDGDFPPAHVARILANAGVAWAALTDHNTVAGQEPFRQVLCERGAIVVAGIEIDARSPQGPMHLLGYGFDLHNEALLRALQTLRHPLRSSARRLVHQAGGRVFLAHPLAALRTIDRLEAFLDWLQPQGLDGLEALHKPYSEETQRRLVDLAERRGLLVVAGSDFHGPHHKDGTSPGVDMPIERWDRFATALGLGQETRARTPVSSGLAAAEGDSGVR